MWLPWILIWVVSFIITWLLLRALFKIDDSCVSLFTDGGEPMFIYLLIPVINVLMASVFLVLAISEKLDLDSEKLIRKLWRLK